MKRIKLAKVFGAVAVSAALALGCAGTALAAGGGWQRSGSDWWYAYDGSGYAASGWERVGGAWYLFDDSGWMETGWKSVGGTWYYLKGSGAMAEGWAHDGSAWYYLEPGSGAMAEGWKSIGGTWYYLQPGSGAMATGWKRVGGDWYWMDPSGAMAANRWVGDYYVGASGAMATDSWIGGYYVGPDGLWVPGKQPSPSQGGQEPAHTHSWQPVYAQKWVEDEPAWDEEVWEWKIVCRCGYVTAGATGDEMSADLDRHNDQVRAEVEAGIRDKRCGGSITKQVQTGTVHHDATGHYEQVKTGEACSCGEVR